MEHTVDGEALARPDEGEDDRRLGEAIRLLRRRAGLTIGALAERAQLSTAMVSLLERGRATPSLRTLRLLGLALDVPVSYFFEAREEDAVARYVVRRGNRRLLRLTRSGVLKEALLPPGKGLLEMYELALNPGGASGTDFMQHEGEKAGYVLAGRLRLTLDGVVELLDPGDTFRFPSSVPHMFDNPGEEVARVIWITTRSCASPG
ncbi:helix-turn-helix domain-containing protein [Sabulicella rubraurantiaca]|uniref:helix-turn-helix domain-containing protein n=1 Tax=Sabulicella rubraurantiaca TaxID=2811429 RepID=UPI001A97C291|nr:XRE family transcriptional regulator [Sabulicella rubraurantiaca]